MKLFPKLLREKQTIFEHAIKGYWLFLAGNNPLDFSWLTKNRRLNL